MSFIDVKKAIRNQQKLNNEIKLFFDFIMSVEFVNDSTMYVYKSESEKQIHITIKHDKIQSNELMVWLAHMNNGKLRMELRLFDKNALLMRYVVYSNNKKSIDIVIDLIKSFRDRMCTNIPNSYLNVWLENMVYDMNIHSRDSEIEYINIHEDEYFNYIILGVTHERIISYIKNTFYSAPQSALIIDEQLTARLVKKLKYISNGKL